MDAKERQRFFGIIAVLVSRLDGEVLIAEQEIANAPEGTISMTPKGMIIKTEAK